MKKNVGTVDKVIRLILAVILITLLVTHAITAFWPVLLGWAFTAVLILTALDGTCALYALFHFSTRPKTLFHVSAHSKKKVREGSNH